MTVKLSIRTEQRLAAVFPSPQDRDQARRILEEECAEHLLRQGSAATGLERIWFAVLKLSGGSLGLLVDAVSLAKLDWRDALFAAGFADDANAHLAWHPAPPA